MCIRDSPHSCVTSPATFSFLLHAGYVFPSRISSILVSLFFPLLQSFRPNAFPCSQFLLSSNGSYVSILRLSRTSMVLFTRITVGSPFFTHNFPAPVDSLFGYRHLVGCPYHLSHEKYFLTNSEDIDVYKRQSYASALVEGKRYPLFEVIK